MRAATSLVVRLHGVETGRLTLGPRELCEFRLLDSYRRAYPRPVLGQRFLDDLEGVLKARARLPAWFSNLLPEGPLRALIAARASVSPQKEFALLRHLGADLPGAVDVEVEGGEPSDVSSIEVGEVSNSDQAWHFSLAGVQLKFSARREGRGMTIPVAGFGGDWILKLPDARYDGVPGNEYATMQWARESGLEVPETALIDLAHVSGLPPETGVRGEREAYAVQRFDRIADGERVHIEDFAQVLGLFPEEKYQRFNYETVARVVHVLTGSVGLQDFVRRLVFVVASGNGDAHHKNWSLIYRDRMRAQLSPAYDQVSTIQYLDQDRLALNFAGSKRWEDVSAESFRRLARKLDADEGLVLHACASAVDAIRQAWARSSAEFGYSRPARDRIDAHLAAVPLFATFD